MTLQEARNLMQIEKICVMSANRCDRNCEHCILVQDDRDLIEAYELVDYALLVLSTTIGSVDLNKVFNIKGENENE